MVKRRRLTKEGAMKILEVIEPTRREQKVLRIVSEFKERGIDSAQHSYDYAQRLLRQNYLKDFPFGLCEAYKRWEAVRSLSSLCRSERDFVLNLCGEDTADWLMDLQSLHVQYGGGVVLSDLVGVEAFRSAVKQIPEIIRNAVKKWELIIGKWSYNELLRFVDDLAAHDNPMKRDHAASALGAVAYILPKRYVQLQKKLMFEEENYNGSLRAVRSIGLLALLDPTEYLEVYEKMKEMDITWKAKYKGYDEHMNAFGLSVGAFLLASFEREEIISVQDNEFKFLLAYVRSKYVSDSVMADSKEEKVAVNELNLFVIQAYDFLTGAFSGRGRDHDIYTGKSTDFKRLLTVLEAGESKDLEEMVDCSRIDIPHYTVVQRLGSGASGTTYKVYSSHLKQYRALKVINPEKVNPKEAELMARLQGRDLDNIVQIHEAGDSFVTVDGEKRYALLMEYVEGETLEEHIDAPERGQRKGIPFDEVVHLSAQVLNSISSLHAQGITHRDLNPRNIKVTPKGTLKVLDFGIATDEPHPTGKGNRRYGVPEQQAADDLFSFALLTYRMATGEHLIIPKKESMGTDTYAEQVASMKRQMYTDGALNEEYKRKIEQVPYIHFDWVDDEHSIISKVIFSALMTKDIEQVKEVYENAGKGYWFMSKDRLIERLREADRRNLIDYMRRIREREGPF